MSDHITVTGVIGTIPSIKTTKDGVPVTSFRLASTTRKFDKVTQKWVDDHTNWYSVALWRNLARNAGRSLEKGQRVVVTGRLSISEWDNGEKSGTNIEITADAIGHDLSWGISTWTRVPTAAPAIADEPWPALPGGADPQTGEIPEDPELNAEPDSGPDAGPDAGDGFLPVLAEVEPLSA